jgi:hypothetical protein
MDQHKTRENMSISLKLKRVTKQDDGSYVVSLIATRDGTDDIVGTKPFQVSSPNELKAKAKPLFEALVKVENDRLAMEAIAQGVIDEIMAEVIQ